MRPRSPGSIHGNSAGQRIRGSGQRVSPIMIWVAGDDMRPPAIAGYLCPTPSAANTRSWQW